MNKHNFLKYTKLARIFIENNGQVFHLDLDKKMQKFVHRLRDIKQVQRNPERTFEVYSIQREFVEHFLTNYSSQALTRFNQDYVIQRFQFYKTGFEKLGFIEGFN